MAPSISGDSLVAHALMAGSPIQLQIKHYVA